MGRTPDAYDGPRIDEAVIWEEQTSDPSEEYRTQFVQGKGLLTFLKGVTRPIGETQHAIWQTEVDAIFVDSPPGSPAAGYRVIVGDSPTGDFSGHAGEIAEWDDSAMVWWFTTPRQGTTTFVKGGDVPYNQQAASTPWVWSKVNPGGAFGQGLQYAQDNTQSSTTSSDFQLKVRLTTTALPLGDYILLWSSIIEGSLASTYVEAQLQQDDASQLAVISVAPGPASSVMFSGHYVLPAFSGIHTFDLEWRRAAGGGNAYIEQARLTLWRII